MLKNSLISLASLLAIATMPSAASASTGCASAKRNYEAVQRQFMIEVVKVCGGRGCDRTPNTPAVKAAQQRMLTAKAQFYRLCGG